MKRQHAMSEGTALLRQSAGYISFDSEMTCLGKLAEGWVEEGNNTYSLVEYHRGGGTHPYPYIGKIT